MHPDPPGDRDAEPTRDRAPGGQTRDARPGDARTSGGRPIRRAATAARSAGVHTGRGLRGGARWAWRTSRRVTTARGAGESGLARVLDLHLVSSAADALIVTALAGSIFFAVPTTEARGRVATSLLVTMVPFILLAPLLGPLLDRARRGRRYALATTMVVRAFLAWVMAGAVVGNAAAFELYPAAFGFLVCQKAYIVTRATAVPRVLPRGTELVAANSRISLAGVAAMVVAAPIGVALTASVGASWTLRLAFVVFAAGTALALALPARIDSDAGEVQARMSGLPEPDDEPARWNIGARAVLGLRANAAVRALTGFLTLFLAFRLRTDPLPGLADTTSVGLVVALAALGGGLGTALGGVLRRVRPERTVVAVLVVTAAVTAWSAIAYGLWPVLAVALMAGSGQALAKLCLDAIIQHDVPEKVRTSAFARSETVLQLAWVLGGFVGLALPLSGAWGLGIAAVGTAGAAAVGVGDLMGLRRAARDTRRPVSVEQGEDADGLDPSGDRYD